MRLKHLAAAFFFLLRAQSVFPNDLPLAEFSIGQYKVCSAVSDYKPKRELTSAEYKAIGRDFKNEIIYNAKPVTFVRAKWDIMLGTLESQVYKVGAFCTAANSRQAQSLFTECIQYFTNRYGKPTEFSSIEAIWDLKDGNIVVNKFDGSADVNIAITSAIAIKLGKR